MSASDMEHRFGFHAATTAEKKEEHGSIREIFKSVAIVLDDKLPAGREAALAITKLEEAMFWANAAIARNNKE
jgi:hypothetical protein